MQKELISGVKWRNYGKKQNYRCNSFGDSNNLCDWIHCYITKANFGRTQLDCYNCTTIFVLDAFH